MGMRITQSITVIYMGMEIIVQMMQQSMAAIIQSTLQKYVKEGPLGEG